MIWFVFSTVTQYFGQKLTEPIAKKKEKEAAEPSMYWLNVAKKPLGPAPPLKKR
jgi:hypothetical protein